MLRTPFRLRLERRPVWPIDLAAAKAIRAFRYAARVQGARQGLKEFEPDVKPQSILGGRGGLKWGGERWIAVTNSHGIMKGFEQPESRQILESAALSIPDGKWMAHAAAASLSLAPQDDPDKRQRHSPRLVRL